MTHIPGHVDTENNSFGALKPILIKNGTPADVVDFPILTAHPFDFKAVKSIPVAFHPYIVPWKDRFMVIAGDLTNWDIHVEAEKKLKDHLKDPKNKKMCDAFHVNPHTLKGIEELNDDKIPLIDLVKDDPIFGTEFRKVLHESAKYMRTSHFKDIYLDKDDNGKVKGIRDTNTIINWITKQAGLIEAGVTL